MELSGVIHFLGDLLGQVIEQVESADGFRLEERVRGLAKRRRAGEDSGSELSAMIDGMDANAARVVAAAFAVYFDLVNLAEDANRVRVLRDRERLAGAEPIEGSIAFALKSARDGGVARSAVESVLASLRIEVVLTSHPTEVKRRTVLSKLARISNHLRMLERDDLLPREFRVLTQALQAEIAGLWLTNRARSTKPDVSDEARTGLYLVENIFWDVIPQVSADLRAAVSEYYPGAFVPARWLQLGAWAGGDRDGNPGVTTAVTVETLRMHRGLAVERHRAGLLDLARRLSVSGRLIPMPERLRAWLSARQPLPAHVQFLEGRYADEPFRLLLSLLAADLAEASRENFARQIANPGSGRSRIVAGEYIALLDLVAAALPPAVRIEYLAVVRAQLEMFGFHAARLDIREHSQRLVSTVAELLESKFGVAEFSLMGDAAQVAVLVGQMRAGARLMQDTGDLSPDAVEVLELFTMLARVQAVFGMDLIGSFIVSMTAGPAHVMSAFFLAWFTGSHLWLEIVPLFETLTHLQEAGTTMRALLAVEEYRIALQERGGVQTVMIGYSDSGKDVGYVASQVALHQAQIDVARTCKDCGVEVMFFHGRGGSVARGGGPLHLAIAGQPTGTINGRIRFTEQGEAIAARYSNHALARRHLHQVASAAIKSSLTDSSNSGNARWETVIADLAQRSRSSYYGLVYESEGFEVFWRNVTPLDEIIRLQIGSRPSVRPGAVVGVREIRAIPWVFSWLQCRFNLPAWYGLGSGLRAQADLGAMQEMYAGWPFFRNLIRNASLALLQADMEIGALYVELVPERALAQKLYRVVADEYKLASETICSVTQSTALLADQEVIRRSIELRNPYVDPLNYLQVDTLRKLRALGESAGPEVEELRTVMVLTINGIAAGLRNSG